MLSVSYSVDAFIWREYTLDEVVRACSNVMFGKVTAIVQEKMRFTVHQIENIRGEEQFKEIKISLATGRENYPEQLMSKLCADAPIVIFYIRVGQERLEALGYVSGLWTRLFAVRDSSENFRWYFTHIEKYMSRTFDGDTAKLQSLIRNIPPEEGQHAPVNIDVFVRRRYTLEEIVRTCSNVIAGKVISVDEKKMRVVIGEIECIKGEEQSSQIIINLATGQADPTKQLMDRLRSDTSVIILYVPMSGKRIEALGYASGVWIRLFAVYDNSKALEWYFVHVEKYMNHVFDGDALKLRSSIQKMVAEKK